MRSTMRKKDREPAPSDDEDMIPLSGAFRPVTLSQGIVATWDDLKVREAYVNKMQHAGKLGAEFRAVTAIAQNDRANGGAGYTGRRWKSAERLCSRRGPFSVMTMVSAKTQPVSPFRHFGSNRSMFMANTMPARNSSPIALSAASSPPLAWWR